MAQKVGDLYAELKLKKDNFEKSLTNSQKRINKFKKGAATAFKALSVAVAAVSAAIMKTIGDTVKYTNAVRKASKATGVAVEEFQALAYAAKQEHGNTQALEKGLGNLTIRLGYAGDGLETYLRYFRTLGIEYKNADGTLRNTEDVFRDIAKVASSGALSTEKLAAITQLFGARAGRELVPMLRKGTEWFDKMAKEADNLGIIMSEKDVEAVKEFDDKMTALKESSNALKRIFVTGLTPSLNSIADMFKENATQAGGLRDSMKDIGEWVGKTGIMIMRFVNNTRELMTDFGAHMTNVLAATLEGLSRIPGVGKGFEGAAHSVRMLNIGFVEQGKALQENEEKYNAMLEDLGGVKEVVDEVSGSPSGDSPGGGIAGLNEELLKYQMGMIEFDLQNKTFEPIITASTEGTKKGAEAVEKAIENAKNETHELSIAAEQALQNMGELFGTMVKEGGDAGAIIKKLIGQLVRMTLLKSIPGGGLLSGFMQVFGFQEGGMTNMPMMNLRPDLAVANENPSTPELIVPIEKFKDLIQVNVHGAATADIFLDASKLPTDVKDEFYRQTIKEAVARDGTR